MSVRLIALTQPVMGTGIADDAEHAQEMLKGNWNPAQSLIAYCARVSNPTNQLNHGTADKLLEYMVENQHWSPFEMAHAIIEINTTRDIARQILRHRSFSFQEFSQRYAAVQKDAVIREARLQDEKNRQNSIDLDDDVEKKQWWFQAQTEVADFASSVYQSALDNGIAKEVARAVLPEGMTPSCLYMSGTIRSWIHYIQLRTGNGTQKEHREIAEGCKSLLVSNFPSLEKVFNDGV